MDEIELEDMNRGMVDLNENAENYPAGLCLYLDEEEMTKLGLDLPQPGEIVHIFAMAKVVSSHAHATEEDSGHHISLQITHMAAEIEDEESAEDVEEEQEEDARSPAEKIYGKKG